MPELLSRSEGEGGGGGQNSGGPFLTAVRGADKLSGQKGNGQSALLPSY